MRKTIPTLGVVSAGLLLAGSPAQAANTDMSSNLNIGIANGIQANVPVQAPVNFCGNAIALLGTASANCVGGAHANYATGHSGGGGYGGGSGGGGGVTDLDSSLNVGIANGIQASGLVQVPINACGNAVGLLGGATASCTGSGATANAYSPKHVHRPSPRPYGTPPRSIVPVKALPTAASGAASGAAKKVKVRIVAHKKEAGLLAGLLSPVTGLLGGGERNGGGGGGSCGNTKMSTFGNAGIANGIQAHVPVQIPVNFSGNAIGILGTASASSVGGASADYC